jgi:uncharacterized membrane protein
MKTVIAISRLSVLLLFAGCAGPIGPPLGLGPGWDEFAGIVIVALIVALAYRPIRRLISNRPNPAHSTSPQDIVRARYARGEITQEEFQSLMQHLSQP